MKCLKCGAELEENAKTCKECGTEVEKKYITKKDFDFVSFILECLTFILAVILKPISSIKKKLDEYSDIKTAGILVGVVALGRMIINLLGNMISAIFVKQINIWKGETKLSVSFEGLKNLNYFDLIVKQLFGFIIVVAAIAGIYYVVSLIMKKTVNYFKLVTITTVSFVPFFIVSSFICVIVNYIYVPASVFLAVGSFIYSIFTFAVSVDGEIEFKDVNFKVYFHTICLTVIFIITYYVVSNSISSSIAGLLK